MTDPLHHVLSALPPESLAWTCDPGTLDFRTTAEIPPVQDIIGQERAVRAVTLGLEMKSPGYNIFLSGFVGSGRATTVQLLLKRLDPRPNPPNDIVYVFNFADLDAPRALELPAGGGRIFARLLANVSRQLHRDLPKAIDTDAYRARRERIGEKARTRQREIIKAFEKKSAAEGFALIQVQVGAMTNPEVVPLLDGAPKGLSDVEELVQSGKLPAAEFERLAEKSRRLSSELQKIVRQVLRIESELAAQLGEFDALTARPLVETLFAPVRERFEDEAPLQEFLDRVETHVLTNLDRFLKSRETAGAGGEGDAAPDGNGARPRLQDVDLEFRVNVLVDNQATRGAPVVIENTPTLARLFGMVERSWSQNGEGPPDHMNIKAGSLHRANGGYLVLNANDVFAEPPIVWNTLKRTLRTGQLEVPGVDAGGGLGQPALKPEPVLVAVKAVLIGDLGTFAALHEHDDEFQKIFKVRADFDVEMENSPENVKLYAAFVERLRRDEKTQSFDRTGLARLAEAGARLAGRRDKLSTRFHVVADYVREASHWAAKEGATIVAARHVDRALEERDFRGRLGHEKLQEMIRDGQIFIDLTGSRVGQVNALSVYDIGEQVFGIPVKITATVGMGTAGIINVERESELSGRTHDKGMQILAGYLRAKYAQDKPLTLSASVVFEQSYTGVDGDSASSTEVYAILSALSGIPVRQDLAVTGSVNQNGDIQPIGDVNEKIEGFFDVCAMNGLSGTQGVLVPRANLTDLMLHPRVVEAARAGKFAIHAVATIDEGISLLTGMPAGERHGKHRFGRDTVNGKVDQRLRDLAAHMRDFGGHP